MKVIHSENPAYGYLCSQVLPSGNRHAAERVCTMQAHSRHVYKTCRCRACLTYMCMHLIQGVCTTYVCSRLAQNVHVLYVYVRLGQRGFSKTYGLLWIIATHKPRLLGLHYLQILRRSTSMQYKGIEQW